MDFLKSLDSFELDLDFFKELISDFDLMALLPDMADVMEWIVTGVGYAMVFAPLVLAFLGLWYLILPAREANHMLGYRFFWGMGSVKSWKFTQRFAGLCWAVLGLILATEARDLRQDLMAMETLDLMYRAIELILHQIYWVVVVSLAVNVVVFILFNFKGEWRSPWKKLGEKVGGKAKEAWENIKAKQGKPAEKTGDAPKEPRKRRERRKKPVMDSEQISSGESNPEQL